MRSGGNIDTNAFNVMQTIAFTFYYLVTLQFHAGKFIHTLHEKMNAFL